jgi:Flp pilus assembly protein TadD
MTQHPAIGRFGSLALVAVMTAFSSFACSTVPPKDPPLIADPPEGGAEVNNQAAANTELDRGLAFLENGHYAEARDHLEKAFAIEPKNANAAANLGIAREKVGDRDGAEAAYKAAIGLDPTLAEAAENLSAMYLDADPPKADAAIAVLKAALEKSPANWKLLENLGYSYGILRDVDNATKAYDAAIAKGDNPLMRFAYGSMLFDNKQPDRAAVQLKKALDGSKDGKDDAPRLVTIGRMLGATKSFGDCVRAFDRAIKIAATDPEWFVSRGVCRHELKDEAGAQEDYNAAIKLNASFAPAHYYLGLSLLLEKKRQSAYTELEKASKGDSKVAKAAKAKMDEIADAGPKGKKKGK